LVGAPAPVPAALAAHQQPGQLAAVVAPPGVAGGGSGPAVGGPLGLNDQRPLMKPLQPLQPPGAPGTLPIIAPGWRPAAPAALPVSVGQALSAQLAQPASAALAPATAGAAA
ncbi:hypothetical protein Vafri_16625, partial [Volvox africanus]